LHYKSVVFNLPEDFGYSITGISMGDGRYDG